MKVKCEKVINELMRRMEHNEALCVSIVTACVIAIFSIISLMFLLVEKDVISGRAITILIILMILAPCMRVIIREIIKICKGE